MTAATASVATIGSPAVGDEPWALDIQRKWWVAGVSAVACAVAEGSFSGVLFANDAVIQALGTDRYRIGWAIGPYLVLLVVAVTASPRLQRSFGSRLPFVAGMLLLGAATAIAAAAQSLEALIVARVLMAAKGVAISVALSQLWLVFPRRKGLAMALYAASMYGAIPMGLALGAFVAFDPSWRAVYLACSVISLVAAAVGWFVLVPDVPSVRCRASWDVPGILLLIVWLGAAAFLTLGGRYFSWTASIEVCLACCVLVMGLAAFVWRELATAEPLVQLRLRPARTLGLTLVALGIFGCIMVGVIETLPVYFALRGYQGIQVGWIVLPGAVVCVATMLTVGVVATPRAMVWTLRLAFAWMTIAIVALERLDLYTSREWIAAVLAAWALGAGLVLPPGLRLTFAGQSPVAVQQLASVKVAMRFLAVIFGSLMVLLVAQQATDAAQDSLRQRIDWRRSAPAQVEARLQNHLVSRGLHADAAREQAKAVIAGWVGANAQAVGHVAGMRYLALLGGAGLVVTLLIKPPSDRGILAADDESMPWPAGR